MHGISRVQEVIVSYKRIDTDNRNDRVIGWIYLDTNGRDGADICIFIRDNGQVGSWEYAAETTPGYFAERKYTGTIDHQGKLLEFPINAFSSAESIWKAGSLEATINGQIVPAKGK